jgi:hypothetical protein
MSNTVRHDAAGAQRRRTDDAYLAWLEAAVDCERAQRHWFDGLPRDHAPLYAAYQAALDREQAAAVELERLSTGDRPTVPARHRIHGHRYTAALVRETPDQGLTG